MSEPAKMKICYVVEKSKKEGGKSFWHRIGVAFVNSDGSLNVKLQAFPVGGEMQIRDYQPRDGDRPAAGAAPRATAPAGYAAPGSGAPVDEDDIPF